MPCFIGSHQLRSPFDLLYYATPLRRGCHPILHQLPPTTLSLAPAITLALVVTIHETPPQPARFTGLHRAVSLQRGQASGATHPVSWLHGASHRLADGRERSRARADLSACGQHAGRGRQAVGRVQDVDAPEQAVMRKCLQVRFYCAQEQTSQAPPPLNLPGAL